MINTFSSVLNQKKGMTLIEIIVGSLLFAIVAVTVSTVLTPLMFAFSIANDTAEYNMLLDDIGNRLTSEISQASDVDFSGDTLTLVIDSTDVIYTFPDGMLFRNEDPVFSIDYYKGKRIFVDVNTTKLPNVIVEITIGSSGGPAASAAVISREYAVRPVLMS